MTSSPAGIDCGTDCSEDFDFEHSRHADSHTRSPVRLSSGWSGHPDCTDGLTMTAGENMELHRFTFETRCHRIRLR